MAIACTYLFTYKLHDYGYLVVVIAVACSLIPVVGFEIIDEVVIVKQYYLFALVRKTTRFYKTGGELQIQPFEIELIDAGDEATGSGVLGLFLLSMPYKTAIRKITITQQTNNNKKIKATIRLENNEYKLLQAFASS